MLKMQIKRLTNAVLVVAMFGGLAAVALISPAPVQVAHAQTGDTPTPKPVDTANTSLSVGQLDVLKPGATFKIPLVLNSDLNVRGVQADFIFNPAQIEIIDFEIGADLQAWADANAQSVQTFSPGGGCGTGARPG